MAGNISISAGAAPAQSRTSVSGGFRLPAQPAPAPQVPAGYQLVYRMGGPRYMYGETPEFGARYSDGGIVPGQIYGNMRGSREGADMFGFFPTMFQSSPYATASQMYTPSLGVMPLIGYPSRYPHVIMGGYTDYGAPIANQAMNMMLPLLMMGLYRQMFPMPGMGAAPAAAAKGSGGGGGGGKKSGGSGGGSASTPSGLPDGRNGRYQNLEEALAQPDSGRVYDYRGFDPDYAMRGVSRTARPAPASGTPFYQRWWQGVKDFVGGGSSQPAAPANPASATLPAVMQGAAAVNPVAQAADNPVQSRPAGKISDPSIQWLYDAGGKIADFNQKMQNAETGYWFLDDLVNPNRPR